jgi:DNA polymerase-3 subunit alpha
MDSMREGRARLYDVIDKAMERAQKSQRERTSGQHGLFMGGAAAPESNEPPLPSVDEWPEHELLASELATLGFYVSGHPLAKHAARLKELGAVDLTNLEGRRNGEEIIVAGMIMSMRPMRSRKGDRWAILSLQDMTGGLEALVFPEAFARLESKLKAGTPLLLKGRVNVEEVGTRLAVQEAKPLDGIDPNGSAVMRVRVDLGSMDEYTLDRLKELFARSPGPCPIAFQLLNADGSAATLRSQQRVKPDEKLLTAVREMCGADAVEVVG